LRPILKEEMKTTLLIVALFTSTLVYSQCACCAGAGVGASNGDYNNGIITLPKKQLLVEAYTEYRTVKEGQAIEDDEKLLRSMYVSSLGVRFGITNRITLSALLPYVFLHTNSGNDNGIGDLSVSATFKIISKSNLNIALQAGVKLPTGIQKNSNFDNSTVIIGSGSYDPMAGIIVSKRINSKLAVQGNTMYKYATAGFQQNYYGSLSVQNISLAYKLRSKDCSCPTDTTNHKCLSDFDWNVSLGYYGEWLDKLKEDNIVDPNSGYYLGFVSLATTLTAKKWSIPITVYVPAVEQMNGSQNKAGYRIRIGIIKTF
jgi:Putative MetA-pathway of phenol degradation